MKTISVTNASGATIYINPEFVTHVMYWTETSCKVFLSNGVEIHVDREMQRVNQMLVSA